MTEPDFLSSSAKLDRANELSDALQDEVYGTLGFLGPAQGVTVRGEFDSQMSEYRVWVDEIERVGMTLLGARIGEIVHDIHSALDHVAWQLVQHGAKPAQTSAAARRVYFPIWDSDTEFSAHVAEQLPGVGPKEMAVIEGMQPYNRLDPAHHFKFGAPLTRLRELYRHDKHQVITPVLVVPAYLPAFIWTDVRTTGRFLDEGPVDLHTPFLRWFVEQTGPSPQVEVKGEFAFEITFEDGASVAIELGHASNEAHKLITRLQRIHDRAAPDDTLRVLID